MNARPAHLRATLLCALAAATASAAGLAGPHDNVQTRAACATAASAALGDRALVFDDPPQPTPPRATDFAAEYWWRAWLIGDGSRTAVWLHCEIVPGATASYAEVLLRAGAQPPAP